MRLLKCRDGRFELTEDLNNDIPEYAILSHTWGKDNEEVTYKDLKDGAGEDKLGYQKIRFCAEQARRDNLHYFWVDTCCIDKSNNNELTTAINSMFRCQPCALPCESAFRSHQWFTRGWTLQELLAPKSVEFFSEDGQHLGSKESLEQQISVVTGITVVALRERDFSRFKVDERFKWAETRKTTRDEDWAYCLLGIFGIFMPLIYGEGREHVVRRLKRTIAENGSISAQSILSTGTPMPEGKYWRRPIPSSGLTVLFEPDKPSIDIVFIHGFTGDPECTWSSKMASARRQPHSPTAREPFEPHSKRRRFNPASTSGYEEGVANTSVLWPRDLVPTTIPLARVLTYGYDTHVRFPEKPPVNRNTVYDIAWDLLVGLESERRAKPTRPVFFVVHSLGGILVKEMLRRSSGCRKGQDHLRGIFKCTAGIIFFGTPHNGSDQRDYLHRIAEKVARAAGVSANEQSIGALLPSFERLRELEDEFSPTAQDRNWLIHSFQEQCGMESLSGQKVVDDVSSSLGIPSIETTEHIGRNHMEMCCFAGLDDVEYKKVAAALCRITTTTSNQPSTKEELHLGEEQKQILLKSLRFDQMDARHMNIRNAHFKTCKWLREKAEYLDWLDSNKLSEHHGLLWIKGKPGSGKSTLMKFALANARKTMKNTIILSFFFNARGSDLEKSVIGTYRSLLWQLLERIPALQDVFGCLESATRTSGCPEWSVESLKAILELAIQSLGKASLVCIIDALDECNEVQIRDMISFFEHLGELTLSAGIWFRVCFSSRHYPHIISRGLDLILEGQEGHSEDIVRYLNSELKIGNSKLAERIRIDILEKAAGIFMWVVLVVGILNKEYDRGRIHALQKRLREIPGDLHELFRDILTRDGQNGSELVLCIQWVLFSKQPLKPEQLYFAILSGVEPDAMSEWDPNEITSEVIRRFILDSSKGLAEVTRSKNPTVQFIHESVKDFLQKENGLVAIWSSLGRNFQGASHERLKQCCVNYISSSTVTCLDIADGLPTANTPAAAELRELVRGKFPFLEHATRNILYHANAAEESGVSQTSFLQSFQLTDWTKLNNLFETHEVRRCSPRASLLYILSERDLAGLIRRQLAEKSSEQSCFDLEDLRYGTPIFAALATSSENAVAAFADFYSTIQPAGSPLRDLCKQFPKQGIKGFGFSRQFTYSRKKSVLTYVAEQDNEEFLALLVATGQGDAEDETNGRSVLSYAAERGYEAVVKVLLTTKRVDVELKDYYDQTPLFWAADAGHEATARLLIENGAAVNSDVHLYRTPLWCAVSQRHDAIARLLVKNGADANSKAHNGQTLLWHAAFESNEGAIRLLLEIGADVNAEDKDGFTPLWAAVARDDKAIIRILLDNGAK